MNMLATILIFFCCAIINIAQHEYIKSVIFIIDYVFFYAQQTISTICKTIPSSLSAVWLWSKRIKYFPKLKLTYFISLLMVLDKILQTQAV